MRQVLIKYIIATLLLMTASSATYGQHAKFVLFGKPNEKGATLPKERKAVHPLTAPYFHEDSFITSDIRAWQLYHDFPKSSLIGGGKAHVTAVQLRLALTDRLQLVAYKDGYADFETGLVDASGAMDIAAGLKYNLIQDWDNDFHVSVGVGYEFKVGKGRVLQNDSEWRFWASANKGFGRLHLGGTVNFFLANDKDQGLGNSDHMTWHLHADYYVCEWFSPVVEINGYHTIDEGTMALPFSGVDVANLGGDKSEDVVTIGIGGEFRLINDLSIRAAYETPLSDRNDLFGYRWTISLIYSF